jgi:hypothetical protein
MSNYLTEQGLLSTIKAALAIEATHEVLDSLVYLAAIYIEQGQTQEGAGILAYILRCEDLASDSYERAEEVWEDLACWICPRVLLDAEDFASKANFEDIIEYVFL